MSDFLENTVCPCCGKDELSFGYSAPPLVWTVECHAEGCEILVCASSEKEAVEKWNAGQWTHRVAGWDEHGHPYYEARENG